MPRIVFFCTGAGGRSLMAAKFAERFAPKDLECAYAGDRKTPVHPLTIDALKEAGFDAPSQIAHTIEDFQSEPCDVLVTLCNHANEICPTLAGSPARLHWPLPDPARKDLPEADGSIELFRAVREEIRKRVEGLFSYGFLDAIQQVRLTLGSLLDNLTDGVLAHDLERRIFFFNRAAQQITLYDYAEVVGQDCHQIFRPLFCGGECVFCEDRKYVPQSKLQYRRSFTTKRGERRDLEMSVVAIHSPLRELIGALVIFKDLSEEVHLRGRLEESRGFCGIVGRHPLMQKVFESIRELADVNVPILIQGESGTGKEVVAAALHRLSRRARGPFVPVNCGALPEGTLESELFGHVRGAFTGAVHDHKGRFALAEGGTIFLDEVSEISPAMQVKLLRVLQEKSFVPVGGEKSFKYDAKVICATNSDLKRLTRRGLFRDDLFYRLAVVPVFLPPLRERSSDIPLLAEHFLDKFSHDAGKSVRDIAPEAMSALIHYDWPGNVRELGNAIQYGIIKCRSGTLDLQHLPPEVREMDAVQKTRQPGRPAKLNPERVADALRQSGDNRARAARLLNVSRTTLYRFLGAVRDGRDRVSEARGRDKGPSDFISPK